MPSVLSAADQAKVQRVYCSTLDSDLSKCKQTLDTLDPQSRITALKTAEQAYANQFFSDVFEIVRRKYTSMEDSVRHLDRVLPSNTSLEKQVAELTARKKALDSESQQLEQSIRAHRRRFLDNDPQEGTPAILGLRTSDDKVLLFFWMALLIFVNLGVFAYFAILKQSHMPIAYIGGTVVILVIAYIVLYNATRIEYKLRPTTL